MFLVIISILIGLGATPVTAYDCFWHGQVDTRPECATRNHCMVSRDLVSVGCVAESSCGTVGGHNAMTCDGHMRTCCCRKGPSCSNAVTRSLLNSICKQFNTKPPVCYSNFPRCYVTNPMTGLTEEEECHEVSDECKFGYSGAQGCVSDRPVNFPPAPAHSPADCHLQAPAPGAKDIPPGCYCKGDLCNTLDNDQFHDLVKSKCDALPPGSDPFRSRVCLLFQQGTCVKGNSTEVCAKPGLFCKFNRVTGEGLGCGSVTECSFWREDDPSSSLPPLYCDGDLCCCPAGKEPCYTPQLKKEVVCLYPMTQAKDCYATCYKDNEVGSCPVKVVPWSPSCLVNGSTGSATGCGDCEKDCTNDDCLCCPAGPVACNNLKYRKEVVCKKFPNSVFCQNSAISLYNDSLSSEVESESNLLLMLRDVGIFVGGYLIVLGLALLVWWLTKKRTRVGDSDDKNTHVYHFYGFRSTADPENLEASDGSSKSALNVTGNV